MRWIGSAPVHVPSVAKSVASSSAVPETAGAVTATGALFTTGAVGSDVASAVPPPFVADTTTRSWAPASAGTGGYVEAVAPAMSVQTPPAHRCQP